ncbi:MAG: FlgD immunoglobulin-like domain containing protein [bacterium]
MKKTCFGFLLSLVVSLAGWCFAQEAPRTLYVLNGLGRTVSKMNLETLEIENDVLTVGDIPNRIHAKGEFVYVVNSSPAGITVIDGKTSSVARSIALAEGSNPWDLAFVGTDKAYVTNLLANSVTVVDLATGDSLNSIAVGQGPEGILVVNNTAYVANTGGFPDYKPSTVSVIDIQTDSVTKTLQVATNPQDLALAPDGKIHVVCTGNFADIEGKVTVIDPFGASDFTPAVVDTVEIGGTPGDIVVTSDGLAFLADFGDGANGFLYSYDATTRQVFHDASDPLRVGNGAMTLLFDDRRGDLYVNNFSDDAVQLLDARDGSVLNTFGFGDGAQAMAILEPITESDPWADAVVSFTPGDGAGFGQNFFPDNILGPPDPDPTLTEFNPSSKPQEILSLGQGGQIILEFSDNFIVDGQGPDFTVFENAFYFFGTTDPFIEAAFVAVSMDGESWVEFPWDTTTFAGFAGVTPTSDNQNPTDPNVSGGDSFDLADVGLPFARFVRLTDIGDLKQEGPFNGDFDLDAVVAVHSQPGQPTAVAEREDAQPERFTLFQNYPNPFNPETRIEFSVSKRSSVQIKILNVQGQPVRTLLDRPFAAGRYSVVWDGSDDGGQSVASGVYFYEMKAGSFRTVRKLTLLR